MKLASETGRWILGVMVLVVAVLLMIPVFWSVRAPLTTFAFTGATTTWTSTSDFDRGDLGNVTLPGTWGYGAPYPPSKTWDAVCCASAAAYNGHVYVFGGWSEKTVAWKYHDTWRYNPATANWTKMADMLHNYSDMGATAWADRIYTFGAQTTGNLNTKQYSYYNVTTNSWHDLGTRNMVVAEDPAAVTYGAYIYFAGATGIEKYNPATDVWTDGVCDVQAGGDTSFHGIIGNRWYFIAGQSGVGVRYYDLSNNTCHNGYDSTPAGWGINGRFDGAYQRPIINNRFYLTLGVRYNATACLAYGAGPGAVDTNCRLPRDTWQYDPANKTWTRYADANVGFAVIGGDDVVNGTLYIFGGATSLETHTFTPSGVVPDGHYAVETSSFSRAASSGSFQLATGLADSFYQQHWAGPTAFWNYVQYNMEHQLDCNQTMSAVGNFSLSDVQKYDVGNEHGCAMFSNWSMVSDFDVHVHVSGWGTGNSTFSGWSSFIVQNNSQLYQWDFPWNAKTSGALVVYYARSGNLVFNLLKNGVQTQCGSTVAGYAPTHWLRLTLSGTTWTLYRSLTDSSYTSVASCTQTVTGPWRFGFGQSQGSGGSQKVWLGGVAMHEFYVASGNVAGVIGEAPYRTSGAWTSQLKTYASNGYPSLLNLTFSGVNAAEKIDRIRILNATGVALYVNNTDITSGSSKSISIPFAIKDWKLEILLAGDGIGTPVIESVSAFSVTRHEVQNVPAGFDDMVRFLFVIAMLSVAIVAIETFPVSSSSHSVPDPQRRNKVRGERRMGWFRSREGRSSGERPHFMYRGRTISGRVRHTIHWRNR